MRITIHLLLTTMFAFCSLSSYTQNTLPYQAALRDENGVPLVNTAVCVRFSIIQESASNTPIFQEEQNVVTDGSGLILLEIGKGLPIIGRFENVIWSSTPTFLRVEVQKDNSYILIGTQELLSVPYAQYADLVGGLRKTLPNGQLYELVTDDLGHTQMILFPKGYSKLVFYDEFNGQGLPDASKWDYEVGFVRAPGTEIQYYTRARVENAFQSNGLLTLRCIANDTITNAYGEVVNRRTVRGKEYHITSASIITKHKYDWTYCRVEARVKVPAGNDVWPAVWMLPTKSEYGSWPKSGEIDILEYWGSNPTKFHYTIHTQTHNHQSPLGGRGNAVYVSNPNDWHVIAIEWHEDRIEWFCDGKMQFRVRKEQGDTWERWPFDKPFYLLLNFAFENKKLDKDILPLDYQIDYIRVFQ